MGKVRLYINKKPRQLMYSIVERNGTRALDTGEFTISRGVPIAKTDEVTYIQDPVDTRHLTGIWNFQDHTRDEAGYDLDADETTNNDCTATYEYGCDGRVAIFTNSTTRAAKILHKESASSTPYVGFDGQFDIIIWATVTGASSPAGYFFSKGNATDYIKISHTAVSSTTSRAKVEIKINNATPVTITGSSVNIYNSAMSTLDSSQYHFIRVKRDENNLVSLIVDGTTEGTATAAGNIDTNDGGDTLLYIGGDIDGSSKPTAKFAQVRYYSGGFLTDDDYLVLRQSRRQALTMKFGGIVWKIKERNHNKTVYCHGFASVLHNTEVKLAGIGNASGDSDIHYNEYTSKNGVEILTHLMSIYDSDYKIIDQDGNNDNDYDFYIAKSTLYDNLVIITIGGKNDSSFSVSPRKILRLEDDDIDFHSGGVSGSNKFSPITYKQGVIRFKDLGYDDTKLVTEVTCIGDIPTKHDRVVMTHGSFSVTVVENGITLKTTGASINHFRNALPDSIIVKNGTDSDGDGGAQLQEIYAPSTPTASADEFRADFFLKRVVLPFTPTGYVTVDYNYEDIELGENFASTSGGDYNTVGRRAKTLFIPQLSRSGTYHRLQNFAGRYLNRYSTLNRRFSLQIPSLVNNIKENYKVKLKSTTHNIDSAFSIKSITYKYPQGTTEINVGEHGFDAYDIFASQTGKTSELRSVLTKHEPL